MMDLVVDWVIQNGGVEQMGINTHKKISKLYKTIDDSQFYSNNIVPKYRSLINVPFNLPNDELLKKFLSEADDAGLKFLKGHKVVGGARASVYNAMPEAGVDALITFMNDFVKVNCLD